MSSPKEFPNPECKAEGECFAKLNGKCQILKETEEHCKYQKEDREMTAGKRYPYRTTGELKRGETNGEKEP